jgi:hypothetical protein
MAKAKPASTAETAPSPKKKRKARKREASRSAATKVATKRRTAKRRARRSVRAAAGVSRLMSATHGAMQRTHRRLSAVIAELRSLQLAIR